MVQFLWGGTLLLDLLLLRPQFSLGWYLNYLLLWYVIFWIIHKFRINRIFRVVAFIIVSILLMCYYNLRSSLRFEQSFSFLLGILFANYDGDLCTNGIQIRKKMIRKENIFKIRYGVILLIISIAILAIKQTSIIRAQPSIFLNIMDLGIKIFASVGILQSVLVLDKIFNFFEKILLYKIFVIMGNVSFELYLIHGYALQIFLLDFEKSVLWFLIVSMAGTMVLYMCNVKLGEILKKIFV